MASKKKLKYPSKFNHTLPVPVLPPLGTDEEWVTAFYEITKAPIELLPEPPPNEVITPFETAMYAMRRAIFSDVIRRKWDASMTWKGVKRKDKAETRMFGEVAFRLLNLCEAVYKEKPLLIYQHPAQWFSKVVLEGEAWGFHLQFPNEDGKWWGIRVEGKPDDKVSKTLMKTVLQRQNDQLYQSDGGCNPFLQPANKQLFGIARQLREEDDSFNRDFYSPYVNARRACTTYFRDHGDVNASDKHGKIKSSRQGRSAKAS